MAKYSTRWTAETARKALDRADRARSDHAFARASGINAQRLAWWRKRLDRPRAGRSGAERSRASTFVEVVGKPSARPATLELLLRNGRQVRVSTDIEPAVLARIADALERTC